MRGVSRIIAVVLAVVMLIIGIGTGMTVAPYMVPAAAPAARGLSGEVPIGALLPLSGPLGQFGENDKVAVELAVAEVNEFLEKIGAGWRLKLYVEDTETKPEVALEKLMSLHAKGG